MDVGARLRQIREAKNMSQGDVEQRTGLLRCYISRVENGHTVPAVETLEKIARAYEIRLYEIFYDGSEGPPELLIPGRREGDDWASHGAGRRLFTRLRDLLSRTSEEDRALVLHMAEKVGRRRASKQ